MRPDWDAIVEAVNTLAEKPNVHRIDGSRHKDDHRFKVYRVEGDVIRVDIQPIKEAKHG